jgi:hypothetical protein
MSSNERTHLQQTTAVLGAPGRNNLETRDLTVPRCAGGGRFVSQWPAERKATEAIWLTSVILRVLSTDTSGGTVRPGKERYCGAHEMASAVRSALAMLRNPCGSPSRHVVGLSCRVDDLVDSLAGE